MASVNVNRNVTDTFYRYKMPRLLAKVEGKGNGIKTVIANMSEIAKALNRPPTYPTKYFGCELGAQIQVDKTNERYIVNGDHEAGKLQDLLDGFIQRYVLCAECDNPETDLTVKRNQIFQSCKACGHARTLESNHRLSTYIIKNPPNGGEVKPGKKDKRNKKSKGEAPTTPGTETDGPPSLDAAADAAKKDSKEASGEDDGEDEDWAVDPDDAESRQMEMSQAMAALTVNEDMEKTQAERLDMFHDFIKKQLDSNSLDGKALITEAERLDVKEKAVLIISQTVLTHDVINQAKKYRNLFLRFTVGSTKAQKYLIGGLEILIMANKDVLLPKVPLVLKAFYDVDVLEEEALLERGQKASKRYVSKDENTQIRSKAEPFLKWLAEAEEESGSEEEDDVEVEFEEANEGKKKVAAVASAQGPASGGDAVMANGAKEEDDFDIDDI